MKLWRYSLLAVASLAFVAGCFVFSACHRAHASPAPAPGVVAPAGTVYFVTDGELVKVGYTTHLDSRLRALQTGNARPLTVLATSPGTFQDEARLHRLLKASWVHGEWFAKTEPVNDCIAQAARGEGLCK